MSSVIRNRNVHWRLSLSLALFLTGCGGGGSGSSDDNSVPANAPTVPGPVYSGITTRANLTDESVGPLVDSIWNVTNLALSMAADAADNPNLPDLVVDETNSGSVSGSVQLRGRILPDETEFLIIDFDNFDDGYGLFNGRIVTEKLQYGTVDVPPIDRVSYFDTSVKIGDEEVIYSGYITRTIEGRPVDFGNVLLSGNIGGHFEPEGVDVKATNFSAAFGQTLKPLLTAAGRVFDSRYGYVDLETVNPWYLDNIDSDLPLPVAGGPITATGLNNRELQLSLIAPDVFALEYMPEGSEIFARSARVTRTGLIENNGFEDAISPEPKGLPIADAGAGITVKPDSTVTLDARYSSQPESAYLNFEWDLAFKPMGSNASLTDANATGPQLVLDKEGGYLLRLQVSDGTFVDEDYVILKADPDASQWAVSPAAAQLLPDQLLLNQDTYDVSLNTGAPLTVTTKPQSLDGTQPDTFSSGQPIQYSYPSPTLARVDVSKPGIYTLELGPGPLDVQRLAVDVPLVFSSQRMNIAEFEFRDDNNFAAAGDLNRDGHMDLVVSGTKLTDIGSGSGARIAVVTILLSDGNNSFQAPVRLTGGDGEEIAIADVNNDGLPDIVTAGSSITGMLDVFIQQESGSFELFRLDRLCWSGINSKPLFVKDINADGLADIVTHGCGNSVMYFLQKPGGILGDAAQSPLGTIGTTQLAAGDLNGDGVNDVVAGVQDSGKPAVALFLGQQGGPLSSLEYVPAPSSSRSEPVLAVKDMNGDGRDDLVVAIEPYNQSNSIIHVLLQSPEGKLETSQSFAVIGRAYRLYLQDIDSDGDQDIGTFSGVGFNIHYKDSNGAFTDPVFEGMVPDVIADIDGDGYNDLVAPGYSHSWSVDAVFGQAPQLP